MGIRNLRAVCPQCGSKIHTQPKGLGHLSLWGNSWFMVQTGTECPYCAVALTGKVTADGHAQRVGAEARTLGGYVKTAGIPGTVLPAEREGWWPDPTGRFGLRYFSGRFWTQHVATDGKQSEDRVKVGTSR